MGLMRRKGWIPGQVVESIWPDDPALVEDIPEAVFEAWAVDKEAKHFRPYVDKGKEARVFKIRTVSVDERAILRDVEGAARTVTEAFRIGVSWDGAKFTTDDGVVRLSDESVIEAITDYGDSIVTVYGLLVWSLCTPDPDQKKASRRLRGPKPSDAAPEAADASKETTPSPA